MPRLSKEERFRRRVIRLNHCWGWDGNHNWKGYAQFDRSGAHRYAYELHVGPIPEGLQLDHLCRNRWCINPEHLEPVTNQENSRRGNTGKTVSGAARLRTHCRNGHELTPENTWKHGHGSRLCRICRAAWEKEYRLKKKQRREAVAS